MSAKVFRNMKLSLAAMYAFSQGKRQLVTFAPILWNAKFMDPILREHISGENSNAAASRSSGDISGLPPVVRLITASVAVWMVGRNWRKTAGLPVGEPSPGS